jgi:hypothetical protein
MFKEVFAVKALLLSRLYMICQFFWSTFGHPARIDPQRRGAEGFVANIGSKPRCFSFSRVRHSDTPAANSAASLTRRSSGWTRASSKHSTATRQSSL